MLLRIQAEASSFLPRLFSSLKSLLLELFLGDPGFLSLSKRRLTELLLSLPCCLFLLLGRKAKACCFLASLLPGLKRLLLELLLRDSTFLGLSKC